MYICANCITQLNTDAPICPHCGYRKNDPGLKPWFLKPGTVLQGRYLVGRSLGAGGYGITYLGYDFRLQRRAAIKEYYPSNLVKRRIRDQVVVPVSTQAEAYYRPGLDSFIEEARKLAEFEKVSQIVNVYDAVTEFGTGYIIMEYIVGKTLSEYLKQGRRYGFEDAKYLICEVLRGLIPIHAAGIIHRDIAPDNIMLTDDDQVRVIDFGASTQMIVGRNASYDVILKPGYAPEEQYRMDGDQGPWTDVYAVGAPFYRLLTGTKLPPSTQRAKGTGVMWPSQMGIDIPDQAEQVLIHSLAVRSDERIRSAEDFLAQLDRSFEQTSLSAAQKILVVIAALGTALIVMFLVLMILEGVINHRSLFTMFGG